MLGIAAKGLALGMNVVRLNQRNCGSWPVWLSAFRPLWNIFL